MAYMLRVRLTDADPWGPPTAYRSKRERDTNERYCRCLGGLRTWTWKETPAEERARFDDEDAAAAASAPTGREE